jgi:GntR family histidine utilization transcriptional repressor
VTATLDQRIRADLEGAIRSGTWAPGHRIPTERELMERYGCARMTVSKAVAELVKAGLIERRKKAGSFVARPHVQTAVLEIPDIAAVITARGDTYRFEVLNRRQVAGASAGVEGRAFGATAPVLHLEGLHVAAGQPFALEHRLIGLEAAPAAVSADFTAEPPGTWLLHHIPWTDARHRITAQNPTAEAARALRIGHATACLSVERWTWREGRPVTFVQQLFPGDAYDLVADFTP